MTWITVSLEVESDPNIVISDRQPVFAIADAHGAKTAARTAAVEVVKRAVELGLIQP